MSYRRQQNLKDLLVHRKHNSLFYKEKPGTFICGRQKCVMCKYVKEGPSFHNNDGSSTFNTKGRIACTTSNLVYGIFCRKCKKVLYVGETMQTLYQRHQQNLSRIRTGQQLDDLINHFRASNNHSLEDYKVFGVEKISKNDAYRKTREKFWISKLGTLKPRGFNVKSY